MKRLFHPLVLACAFVFALASCELTPYAGQDSNQEKKGDEGKEGGDDEGDEPQDKLSTAFLNARENVAAMGAGWNLGNTLDANSGDTTNMWIEGWGPGGVSDYEKAWGQVPPTKALFKMLRQKGFRSVRVPVTWYPHMGTEFNTQIVNNQPLWRPSVNPLGYTVDPVWMAEVKRVVDAVLEADMYCIINIHHDTGTANTHWLVASSDNYSQSCDRFKGLWTQIAETFKDYDGRLLFESFNEMTDAADSWCFASFSTQAHYDAAMAADAYATINAYNQDFVTAVRATGGNNAERNLVVNTYAACSGEGNWNVHLKDPLQQMELPEDTAQGHLIFQVHCYPEFSTLNDGKKKVDDIVGSLNSILVPKGAPVIIGEWGAGGNSGIKYDQNTPAYLSYARYFVEQATKSNIAMFYWMGICDGQDRAGDKPKFTQEDLAEAIISGTGKAVN